jgi:uncharacterized protein (UPF0332 family)
VTPDDQTRAVANYRFARAQETLSEARLLVDAGLHRGAANRIYYSAFYAVSGLLLLMGHASAKHSGVRSLFDRHCIAAGLLPMDDGRLYRRLFEARQKGDYDDLATFDSEDVRQWLGETAALVERIQVLADRFWPKDRWAFGPQPERPPDIGYFPLAPAFFVTTSMETILSPTLTARTTSIPFVTFPKTQ